MALHPVPFLSLVTLKSIYVVAGTNSMEEAISLLKTHPIDVILMDVNMPAVSGIEATIRIKKLYPTIKVIALTMHEDIGVIAKILKAGAS